MPDTKMSTTEAPQMKVSAKDLAGWADVARRNGTEVNFIPVALQWAAQASAEIDRLHAALAQQAVPQTPAAELIRDSLAVLRRYCKGKWPQEQSVEVLADALSQAVPQAGGLSDDEIDAVFMHYAGQDPFGAAKCLRACYALEFRGIARALLARAGAVEGGR